MGEGVDICQNRGYREKSAPPIEVLLGQKRSPKWVDLSGNGHGGPVVFNCRPGKSLRARSSRQGLSSEALFPAGEVIMARVKAKRKQN